jgi:hypothetical protein
MKRASIFAAICLGLFGLPFLGMGLAFMFQSASRGGTQGWMGAIFGFFFACIGLLLIAMAVAGVRISKQQDAARAANPDKPWLWRKDWAEGRANGRDPRANITAWVFTAFWDVMSALVAFTVLPNLIKDGDLKVILAATFPLAGIFITAFAARGTLRIWRYGRTSFWCDSVPFSPGGRVEGSIHLKLPTSTPHGVDLRLSCKRRIVTGSGENGSVNELVLWQEEKNIPAEAMMYGLQDAQLPVEFALPADACETDEHNPGDRVHWQLHARADVPGVDFSDNYELPVFRTQASAAAASGAAESFGAAPARSVVEPQAESPAPAPATTHIVYREDEQGTSFYFPPLRNHAQAVGVVAFATIWSAVVYFLWTDQHAPWFFRIVFSLCEIVVGYALLSVVFGSALIRVRAGVLQIRRAMLGLGSLQEIPLNEVVSILPLSQGQINTSGNVLYGISIKKSDGREIKLVANSLSTIEARWVVSTLERAMGRKQETRVQFQSIYGAPPQSRPGFAGAGQANVPLKFNRSPRFVGVIGFAVWLLVMGSMFYRGFSHSAGKRAARSSSATSSRSTIPIAPMTDKDAVRISALPTQQQAEELLARSIGHDERALEMFKERIEGWTSNVRLTDRMQQLDAQATYSTDLRVREADADLWLAMEGWHRNQEAVDLLLRRAGQDKQYRPTAYYFLGMEGSRGIAAAHAFAVLRDRALNDPDPVVRQQAVEGLRFFKTNDALEVLYQSFTQDASYKVRDRAGCNLSDCGIFTRAQRMRLVPRLIELADDRRLKAQMRNWVFMALREITDVSLPPDANAWRNWYAQHGAEKLAEFEALPWYQVRGDH